MIFENKIYNIMQKQEQKNMSYFLIQLAVVTIYKIITDMYVIQNSAGNLNYDCIF